MAAEYSSKQNTCIKTEYIFIESALQFKVWQNAHLSASVGEAAMVGIEQEGSLNAVQGSTRKRSVEQIRGEVGQFAERPLCYAARSRSETAMRGKGLVIILDKQFR